MSAEPIIVAASLCDGNIVNLVSSADPFTMTPVTRMVGSANVSFPAPTCVSAYNANVQGVDRLDQIRSRFSISDSHSFKRWHKKLALALIDVARANAYLTRRLVCGASVARDAHRDFVADLVCELQNGKWAEVMSDYRMLFGRKKEQDMEDHASTIASAPTIMSDRSLGGPMTECYSVSLKQIYADKNRKRRRWIVCQWKGRYPTEITNY